MRVHLEHLGYSGLLLRAEGLRLAVDPPAAMDAPTLLTWTERERVAGALARDIAALPEVLGWLGATGVPLDLERPVPFAGVQVACTAYRPIPYATFPEALRKTRSGLAHPLRAARRLAFTLGRPPAPPVVVEIRWEGCRLVHLGQSLHRFLDPRDLARLVDRHRGADIALAGTDYDDEEATGRLLHRFEAGTCVIADLVGEVRRDLGLPTRPLEVCLEDAPPETRLLPPGGEVEVELR